MTEASAKQFWFLQQLLDIWAFPALKAEFCSSAQIQEAAQKDSARNGWDVKTGQATLQEMQSVPQSRIQSRVISDGSHCGDLKGVAVCWRNTFAPMAAAVTFQSTEAHKGSCMSVKSCKPKVDEECAEKGEAVAEGDLGDELGVESSWIHGWQG